MPVTVTRINPTRKELLPYVKFGINLYNDNPYFVPPLVIDELDTLNPERNPASEICDSASFMAWRDGQTGRPHNRYHQPLGQRAHRPA